MITSGFHGCRMEAHGLYTDMDGGTMRVKWKPRKKKGGLKMKWKKK